MISFPILVFDIETVPDVVGIRKLYDLDQTVLDQQVAQIAFDAQQAKAGNTFLPHYLQRIVAISCVLRRISRQRIPELYVASLGSEADDEAILISKFFELIEKYTPQLVSWNGGGFDLPVLHYRALIHGVSAVRYWEMGEGLSADSRDFKWNNYINRYHLRHLDLMDLLAMYQPRANAPLDELAKLNGFPGKIGMDGSQVWEAYQAGQLDKIRQYCEMDVMNTYLLYCRFQLMRGGFTAEEYATEMTFVKTYLANMPAHSQWTVYLQAFA